MKFGMDSLFAQAGKMQQELAKVQQELELQTVEGHSGAGLVTVQMNGKHQVLRVTLDPSLMKEERSMVEDMLVAAYNDASRQLARKMQDQMSSLATGLGLPAGFKMPF